MNTGTHGHDAPAATDSDGTDHPPCAFELDPEAWEAEHGLPPDRETHWSCTEPQLESSECCEFHADADARTAAGRAERDVFDRLLERDDPIYGARFDDLTFYRDTLQTPSESGSADRSPSDAGLDAAYELHTPVIDTLHVDSADVDAPLSIRGGALGTVSLDETTVDERLAFHGCRIGELAIEESHVSDHLVFEDCRFERTPTLVDSTVTSAAFQASSFENGFYAHNSTFDTLAFEDTTHRMGTVIHECDIEGALTFTPTDPGPIAALSSTSMERCRCHNTSTTDVLIRLDGATVHGGHLRQGADADTYYDLHHATLGDVRLANTEHSFEHYRFDGTSLKDFDFVAHREQLERSNWTLHDSDVDARTFDTALDDVVPSDEDAPSKSPTNSSPASPTNSSPAPPTNSLPAPPTSSRLRDHQETYALATRGAHEQGDDASAAKFFVKESRARKHHYRHQLLDADRRDPRSVWTPLRRYVESCVLDYTTLYGEAPLRPLAWSLIVIVGCGVLGYPVVGGVTSSTRELAYGGASSLATVLFESLYFSMVTFTTVGYGNYTPSTWPSKLLAGTEALLGGILIALFIFNLGRSMKR